MSDKAATTISIAAVIITIIICLTYISLNHSYITTAEITSPAGGNDYFYIHKVNRFNSSSETYMCDIQSGCKKIFDLEGGLSSNTGNDQKSGD